jgi:hypothetical protein
MNLFPITANANSKHLHWIEKHVKKDVAAGYVGKYTVTAVNKGVTKLQDAKGLAPILYTVESVFKCGYQRLDIDLKEVGSKVSIDIASKFEGRNNEKKDGEEYSDKFAEAGLKDKSGKLTDVGKNAKVAKNDRYEAEARDKQVDNTSRNKNPTDSNYETKYKTVHKVTGSKAKLASPDAEWRSDPQEKEADTIANQVTASKPVRGPAPAESISRTSTQPQAKAEAGAQAIGAHSSDLESTKGGGSPMADPLRNDMEDRMGADFSNVRVHTDSKAQDMSSGISAEAFAHGNDIYFNKGKYAPESKEGKHLLAHELTHTIQQDASPASESGKGSVRTGRDLSTQRKEEGAAKEKSKTPQEIQLEKQLAQSNKEQKSAVDPGPAIAAKNEAKNAKPEEKPKPKGGKGGKGESPPPAKAAPNGEGAKGKPQPKGGKAAVEGLGAVGQAFEKESEQVCPDAEAKTQQLAANEQTHDSAEDKLKQSEEAVVPPALEGQAASSAKQVEGLEKTEAPKPDPAKAKATLDKEIASSVPSDVSSMNEFKSKGKAKVVGNKVMKEVKKDVDSVKGTYNKIEQKPAAKAPTQQAKPMPETEAAPATPQMDLGKNAVPVLKPEHTETKHFENESEDLMKKEGITDEQLDMVDSGDLAEAKKEKKTLKKKAVEEPKKIKESAEKKRQKVDSDMKAEEKKERDVLAKKRKGGLSDTKKKQVKTKTDLEKKRDKVTADINGIYDATQKSVTGKLNKLEKANMAAFVAGQARLSVRFENEVNNDVNAWKRKRYSGFWGPAKWLKDKFVGIDGFPAVNNAFKRARKRYVSNIDKLIKVINDANKKVIKGCKEELAGAQKKIKKYVDGLGPELKSAGKQAMKEMKKKLEELDKLINKKQKELTDKLCKGKEAAIKAIDKKIEKMKEDMSGLLSKLGNLLLDAMMKFFEWAMTAAGMDPAKIMGIINKGKKVIKAIVTDPVGFFKNVVKSVKGGITNFQTNIKKHLLNGMMGWLTGNMGDIDIELPEKWNLKGVMSMAMQVMGLSWNMIRKKLVVRLGPKGEKLMAKAEKGIGIIKDLVTKGPIALWELVKEKAGEIKAKLMEGIRNWIVTKLVEKAIIKLISMLNPVGAIVQAIMMIYDTVMFFVENWDRIVDFVGSIFSSIGDMAMGKVGAASALIEKAMAMTIPIILNFLSRLLGLSGVGKAVKRILKKIRKPIDKVINKAVKKMAKTVKKLFGKGGGKGGKKGDKKDDGKNKGDPKGDEKLSAKDIQKHKKYAKEMKQAMEKPASKASVDFKAFHSERKALGKTLEKKYNPKVKQKHKGKTIKTKVIFTDVSKDQKDGDVDFKIVIAPNDARESGEVKGQGDTLDFSKLQVRLPSKRGSKLLVRKGTDMGNIHVGQYKLTTFLEHHLDDSGSDAEKKKLEAKILQLAGGVELMTKAGNAKHKTSTARQNEIIKELTKISEVLTKLSGAKKLKLPKKASYSEGGKSNSILKLHQGNARGDKGSPTGTSPEVAYIDEQKMGGSSNAAYMRMHLNYGKLGGGNGPKNWVAAPQWTNKSGAIRNVEDAAYKYMSASKENVIWYKASAQWRPADPSWKADGQPLATRFPKFVNLSFGTYAVKPDGTLGNMKGALAKSGNIEVPAPIKATFHIPKISQPSKTDYLSSKVPRLKRNSISKVMTADFVDTMKKAAPYGNFEQFRENMVAIDPSLESSIDAKIAGLERLIVNDVIQW